MTSIIPADNEEVFIVNTLLDLVTLKNEKTFKIMGGDGESTDSTVEAAEPYALIINTQKRKANHMNLGAKHTKSKFQYFVHADMTVSPGAWTTIKVTIAGGWNSGGFRNAVKTDTKILKWITRLFHFWLNTKSKAKSKLFYGNNRIFIRKNVFDKKGGFKEIPIMEGYDYSKRMLASSKVGLISNPKLIEDVRRHLKDEFIRTRIKWRVIKQLYVLGVSPEKLDR